MTWTKPTRIIRSPGPAFTPSIEVADGGTIGVTYYDFRNNTKAAGLLSDYWLVHCHPRADCRRRSRWSETHVAGPFDMEKAPVASGYFLGDYQGLGSVGSSFQCLFAEARTSHNPSAVFFTTVSPEALAAA